MALSTLLNITSFNEQHCIATHSKQFFGLVYNATANFELEIT